jgi:hypothetical protein
MKISTRHPLPFAMFQKLCLLSALSCALTFAMTGKSVAAESTEDANTSTATSNYTVPQSTPVDKLVQKVYVNSPLNMTVLRKVLTDANPKVITGNPQQRVKAGAIVVVPDHAQVVKNVLAPIAASASESHESGPAARDYPSRRQWVRFP